MPNELVAELSCLALTLGVFTRTLLVVLKRHARDGRADQFNPAQSENDSGGDNNPQRDCGAGVENLQKIQPDLLSIHFQMQTSALESFCNAKGALWLK